MAEPTAAAPFLTRRRLIQIGIETVRGQAVTPALDLLTTDLTIKNDTTYTEREDSSAWGGTAGASEGSRSGSISFTFSPIGNGNGSSPAFDAATAAVMNMCGFVVVTGVYQRTRIPSSQVTCTIYAYCDGKRYKLAGCAGNLVFSIEQNKDFVCTVEAKGVWVTPDTAALPTPSYTAVVAPRSADCVLAFGSYYPAISRLKLDAGWDVQPHEALAGGAGGTGAGISHFVLAKGYSKLTADPLANTANDLDAALVAGTTYATTLTVGTALGNKYVIAIATLAYRNVNPADRRDFFVHDLNGVGQGNADMTITVTQP